MMEMFINYEMLIGWLASIKFYFRHMFLEVS